MKKTKRNEAIEAEVVETKEEELQELPEEEEVAEIVAEPEEEPKKKPFWKSKKFLVGLGVLGGVGIAALSLFGISKASENPYALEGAFDGEDPCVSCNGGDCDNCPVNDSFEDDSDEDSEEDTEE